MLSSTTSLMSRNSWTKRALLGLLQPVSGRADVPSYISCAVCRQRAYFEDGVGAAHLIGLSLNALDARGSFGMFVSKITRVLALLLISPTAKAMRIGQLSKTTSSLIVM